MMKCRFRMVFSVFLACVAMLVTSAAPVNAETGTVNDDQWRKVVYSYKNYDDKMISSSVGYSDEILMVDARMDEPDPSIAKVSVGLAAAAYDPLNMYTDYKGVNEILSAMGFTVLRNVNYDRTSTYLDNDFVAFTVASKQIRMNGEDYIAYCIPVRGTDGREWYSDFNLGENGDHEGFYTAAQEIFQVFEGIMNDDGYDKEHRMIWMTGHSRGAAVANIVEGELTADSSYALPEHIFGYNFACPAISRNEKVTGTDFSNIFNFNNIGDLIPLLPMADWNYGTYGKSLFLDTTHIDNVRFQLKRSMDHDYSAPMTQEGYLKSLQLIAGTEEDFKDKEIDIALFLLASILSGDLNPNQGMRGFQTFIKTCYEKLGKDLSTDAAGTILSIMDFFVMTKPEVAVTEGYIEYLENGLNVLNSYHIEDNAEELISTWFGRERDKLETIQSFLTLFDMPVINTESKVSAALSLLQSIMGKFKELKTAGRIAGIMGLFYTTEGNLLGAFTDGHHPQTYITWINSMYLGSNGWNSYTGTIPSFKRIKSIDDNCFVNVQQDVNPAYFNDNPEQIQYYGEKALYNNTITQLTLYKETDYVGAQAFGENKSLTKVTIPVDSLCLNAKPFEGCVNIETLIYTPGETGIMAEQTTSYESGKILANYRIESIAHDALKTLIYEEGVKEIAACAGYGYYGSDSSYNHPIAWETISLPESLEKIGSSAFGFESPEEFHLGSNLREIGDFAFTLSKSRFTGDLKNLEKVGQCAFQGTAITSEIIKLPGKVKTIGNNAFESCKGLTGTIEILADQEIGDGAFYGCTGLTKVVLPVDLIYTHQYGNHSFTQYTNGYVGNGGSLFGGCAIQEIEYKPGETGIMPEIETHLEIASDKGTQYKNNRIEYTNNVKKIVFDEGVTEIAAYACYDMRYSSMGQLNMTLEEVVLPSTLKKIGEYAFYQCGKPKITINGPLYPEEIGTYAFYDCDDLTPQNMPIPGKLKRFSPYVFYDCDNLLEEYTVTGNEVFGEKCFGSVDSLRKITIPVDSLCLNGNPFAGCVNIETLIYTPGETGIMAEQTTSYESGKILANYRIESIAHDALKTLIYEEGVKEIAAYAGYGYYGSDGGYNHPIAWETISLPESLEKIGSSAFGFESPEEFHLGSNLREIGDFAFTLSKSRFTGDLKNLEKVGQCAFQGTAITSEIIKLPGKVKTIGNNAFESCKGLTGTIEILADQEIGDGAFYGCTGLTKVVLPVDLIYTHQYGNHSFTQYTNGYVGNGGPIFGGCAIQEIEYKPGETGVMPVIETHREIAVQNGTQYKNNRIEYTSGVKKIVFDEGITEIAAYACYDMRYSSMGQLNMTLEEVVLPSTLKKIGEYAFYHTGLSSVYLPKTVETIGGNAFTGNSTLTLYVYRNTVSHRYAVNTKIPYVLLDPPATAISLPSEKEIPLGSTEQLKVTYTPEDATDPLFWTSSDEMIAKVDENGMVTAVSTGTAIITAATETELSTQIMITVTSRGADIYGSSLALDSKIGINFYLDIPEEEQEYLNVVMTMNGNETIIPAEAGTKRVISKHTYMMYEYPVTAKEMRDIVTLTVTDKENHKVKLTKGEEDYTEGYPYSASEYFARVEEVGQEKTKKLSRVLNNYGKYAQTYFDYKVTDEVKDTVSVADVTAETLESYKAVMTEETVDGLTYAGGSTMLDDAIGFRIYFKVGSGYDIKKYTFTIDNKAVTPEKSGSMYFVELADIAAKDLGVMHTIKATDGTKTFGIQYSALSYARRVLELTGEDRVPLQNMCRAMYLYNQQAIEYFNTK